MVYRQGNIVAVGYSYLMQRACAFDHRPAWLMQEQLDAAIALHRALYARMLDGHRNDAFSRDVYEPTHTDNFFRARRFFEHGDIS